MKILIVNPGSTSYKCKLLDGESLSVLFEAGVERIGEERSVLTWKFSGSEAVREERWISGYPEAIRLVLAGIGEKIPLSSVTAVGFKVVLAKGISGCAALEEDVVKAMEEYIPLAPVHNRVYIAAIREMRKALPGIPLVGLFETAFHSSIPEEAYLYGVPAEWHEKYGVRKYGFHGASHRFVAERSKELFFRDRERYKIISCHLGGSSSVCAVRDGVSVDTSMGMSPQSGLLNAKRTGDLDAFALLYVMEKEGLSCEEARDILVSRSGVYGLSGGSADFRDIAAKMRTGDKKAESAFKTFAYYVKRYIGEYIAVLDMPDLIVFTGGLGQNSPEMREEIAGGLSNIGIILDRQKNLGNPAEGLISSDKSRVMVAVMPTNEERVVAEAVRGYLLKKVYG